MGAYPVDKGELTGEERALGKGSVVFTGVVDAWFTGSDGADLQK